MTRRTKVQIVAALAGVIVASFIVLPIYLREGGQGDRAPASATSTPETPPPLPPPPPCIREHCFERPKHLRCVAWAPTNQNAPCANFEIDYEAHCDCVEWGVRPAGGGP